MRTLAHYIIPDRRLASSATGAAFTFPTLTAGQDYELGLRFLDRVDGELVEVFPYVRHATFSIGRIDVPPDSGQWGLKITADSQTGANTASNLDWNIGQGSLETKLNALTGKPAAIEVVAVPGGFLLHRPDGGQLSLSIVQNTLSPRAFVEIDGWEEGGIWYYELRPRQAPLAFTSNHDRVDPAAPRIEALADGGNNGSGGSTWNEVQKLIIPSEFRGGFVIRNPDAVTRTRRLDNSDTQDSIGEALTALMGDTVTVTDSQTPGVAFVEFTGELLAASDQPLLEIEVIDTPPGDVTMVLPLRLPALRAALRTTTLLKDQPLELSFDFVASQDDVADPFAPGTRNTSSGLKASIAREVAWEDLEEVADVDWVLPPRDQKLLHWDASQVAQGVQHYVRTLGDGSAASIAVTHNLNSEEPAQILIYNQSTKVALRHGTDYTFAVTSANVITVTFIGGAPTLNQHKIVVTAAVPIEAFAGHEHDTAQISRDGTPLNDILDGIGENLEILNAVLSGTGPGATPATQASGLTFLFPEVKEVLFFPGDANTIFNATSTSKVARGNYEADDKELFNERSVLNVAALPAKGPLMLPACHDSSVTDVTALPSVAAGSVWKNNASPVLLLPGGGGLKGAPKSIKQNEFIASDGRILFKALRSGTTNSYYPQAFERELWRIHINDKMLALGRTLDAQFGLALQLVNATSNAHWVLVIEKGTSPEDTTPSTVGANLQNIVWSATPILSQRIILSPVMETHSFGARIKRSIVSSVDTITADAMLYGIWSGANSVAPSTANFSLRARLVNFDTENDLAADARGWVTYQVISPGGLDSETGEQTTTRAKAVIL